MGALALDGGNVDLFHGFVSSWSTNGAQKSQMVFADRWAIGNHNHAFFLGNGLFMEYFENDFE